MKTTKRKRSDESAREAQREAILLAGEELLRTEGPATLTMRRIAERVGYTTTVLYLHFANKNELCQALYVRGFRLQQEIMKKAMGEVDPGDPVALLRAMVRGYVNFAAEHPSLYGLMFLRTVPDFEPIPQSEASQSGADVLRGVLQLGVAQGVFHPFDVAETARVLWATMHGLLSLSQNRLFGYAPDEADEKMAKLPELACDLALSGLLRRRGE
jgi:AcrR family transcriptional regulator